MKNLAVLTSGGDAPGMNAALRAVVRAGAYHGLQVFGVERGYQGLIADTIEAIGPRDVSDIICRGGTILHSARCKAFYEAEGRAAAAANLKKHGIEALVVIGGDGSYRGASLLEEEHGVRCIGLPGTIDNDIGGTDFTIGFNTALNTAMEAIDRIRDTAHSHDRVFFVEVMGRRSGFLAIMSAIAGGAEDVLVPESPTDVESIIRKLNAGREKGKTSSIVVVAEGDEAGNAFEIARRVGELPGFSGGARVTILGHLQRGGSPTAFDRILASRLGVRAVEALLERESGKMVGVNANEVVLRPFSDAWEAGAPFDPSYLKLAEVLAT